MGKGAIVNGNYGASNDLDCVRTIRRCGTMNGLPLSRQEFLDLANIHGEQTAQNIGEVFLGVDAPPPTADD